MPDDSDTIPVLFPDAESASPVVVQRDPPPGRRDVAWLLVPLILAVGAFILGYELLVDGRLEQTSALFVGLPCLLACVLVLTPSPESLAGGCVYATVLSLLIAWMFLGEGFICVLMMAPLFIGVAAVVGGLIAAVSRGLRGGWSGVLVLPVLLSSLEGTREELSLPRHSEVTVVRVLEASPAEVEAALGRAPDLSRLDVPLYFRLGFPLPVAAEGEGLQPGSPRLVSFAGGEGRPGGLLMLVEHSAPGFVSFTAIQDTSHIAHWMNWKESRVSWRELPGGGTEVEWTLRYERLLDPAWYFDPWQRYAVGRAGEVLIDTLDLPAAEGPAR